jgi:hypothetical protein
MSKSNERVGWDLRNMVRDENDIRRKIVDAIGIMKRLVGDFRYDEWIQKAGKDALQALNVALKGTDEIIGRTMSERSDREMGFVSSREFCAGNWTSIARMRKDLDEMREQVTRWLEREKEAVDSGKANFSYLQYYGAAIDALEVCADKLQKMERMV